ncbi:hypothetical protein BHM03_00015284 [Ensete ventricosum]|nr:hypothetical protein BHM03_00015284 [Ensete ventricosum]
MFRLYHISQLQDLVQNYLEYLGMAWFNHSLMLVRFHHQVRKVVAAMTIKFDDSGKQARYESISFQEIQAEINELKALTVTTACRYPDKDAQYHFFKNYLEPEKPHEVRKLDVGVLLPTRANFLLITSTQAKVSPIDFDYLCYFFLRYNEYKKQKEACFSLAHNYLGRSSSH